MARQELGPVELAGGISIFRHSKLEKHSLHSVEEACPDPFV
jgi:hypothetical protein